LNDLIEGARSDVFNNDPIQELIDLNKDDTLNPEICLIEQHTFCDLDGDNYKEPYIVTIIKDSGKVLRIAPRFTSKMIKEKNGKIKFIDALHFFTDYHFLVSPKGKFQSVGFGILMLHLNESINSLMNQLTDAGQLANMQGGYIDARFKEVEGDGNGLVAGEWQRMKAMGSITLKEGVLPINYKEPSSVLFQMLGLIIDSSKELSSSTELMNGASSPENVKSGAVMAMIDQGMKLFTSIQNRIYRSLSKEYRKVFHLNGLYLDPAKYVNVVDDQLAVLQDDFDENRVDILPVADPNLSSEAQRISRYQILLQLINLPGLKPDMISKRLIQALNIPNTDELFLSDKEKQSAPPPIEVVKMQQEMEGHSHELELKKRALDMQEKQMQIDAYKTQCDILKMKTEAILNIAKAESLEAGTQLQDYASQADMISKQIDTVMADKKMQHEKELQTAKLTSQQAIPTNQGPSQQPPIQALGPDGQPTS